MVDRSIGRRKTNRFEAKFQVRFRNLENLIEAYTKNISKGGIFIRTNRLLPVNSIVRVNLQLPQTEREIRCIARVVRVLGEDVGKEKTGMAMEFLDLSKGDLEFIESTIAEHAVREAETSMPPRFADTLSVLVVDDDKIHRDFGAQAFKADGHRVQTAKDGVEALSICLKSPPDVVLTDVNMPKMDGWSFLRTIRARPSLASTLVIFQTTLSGEADRLKGYQLGVDDYLAKPYEPATLLSRVDSLLARRSARTNTPSNKALRGNLEQVSLATVLSLLELERKTGVVIVVSEVTARIFVRGGRPLDVEVEGAPPESNPITFAVDLLKWKKGQFEFAPQDVNHSDTLNMSMQGFLMEAARLDDEGGRSQ